MAQDVCPSQVAASHLQEEPRHAMNSFSPGNGRPAAKQEPTPDPRLRAANVTRGTVVATFLELADTGAKRNKGLLGREGLAAGEGLWIVPCESVHTFFMQFAIDLVYLDRNHRVKKVRRAVGPWRVSACLSAHSILELPAGTIEASGTERGDQLQISPHVAADNAGA
jgi:uncharacterized membrane protein (UPF0127 family)